MNSLVSQACPQADEKITNGMDVNLRLAAMIHYINSVATVDRDELFVSEQIK